MMKDKETLKYIIIIIIMTLILGVLWFLIVTDKSNRTNDNTPIQTNSSSTSYSASKEITKDETITRVLNYYHYVSLYYDSFTNLPHMCSGVSSRRIVPLMLALISSSIHSSSSVNLWLSFLAISFMTS